MTKLQNLDSLPKDSDAYIWADYIEMLCLVNADGIVTRSDILDRVRERSDLGEIAELEERITKEAEDVPAEIDDRWTLQAIEWFEHLQYRSFAFGEDYPYLLENSNTTIRRRPTLTVQQKFYVILLLASNLRHLDRKTSLIFTGTFEVISKNALRRFLPEDAQVYIFGSGGNIETEKRYTGNLWTKVNKLAEDLCENVVAREIEFNPKNVGDNGLDIVAWISLGDRNRGHILVFGQCACSKDEWVAKQSSSHVISWRPIIRFIAPPSNMVFIPFCYRRPDGSWFAEINIHESIVVDRPRLCYALNKRLNTVPLDHCYTVIATVMTHYEDLL